MARRHFKLGIVDLIYLGIRKQYRHTLYDTGRLILKFKLRLCLLNSSTNTVDLERSLKKKREKNAI